MAKGAGIAIGLAIGVAIGVATGNLGLWIALGVVFGVVFEARQNGTDGQNAENDARSAEREAAVARILAEMHKRGTMTNHEVRKMLGVSDSAAERYLQELESDGKIQQIGTTGQSVSYKAL
jgi:predicted HTH transcriptional regulator